MPVAMDSDDSANECSLIIDENGGSQDGIRSRTPTENKANSREQDAAKNARAPSTSSASNAIANGHDNNESSKHSDNSDKSVKLVIKKRRQSHAENGNSNHSKPKQMYRADSKANIIAGVERRDSSDVATTSNTSDKSQNKSKKSAGADKARRRSEHRDKSKHGRSSKDKHKSSDTKKKPHYPKKYEITDGDKKIQATRLITVNPSEQRQLKLTMQKHQFYNMKLFVTKDSLLVNFPAAYPAPPTIPDIKFEQLLEWPGVSITVAVDHFKIRHAFKSNLRRQIVCDNDPLIELAAEPNVMEPRYVSSAAPTSRRNKTIARSAVLTYIPALLKAGAIYDIQASKLNELKMAFDVIKRDLKAMPYDELEMRSTHSQYQNKYKYVRYFPNDATSPNIQAACVREVINPEMNFFIERCLFTVETIDIWLDQMNDILKEMFVHKSKLYGDGLRERFKKCITLECEFCYVTFDGALGSVAMIAHMKEKHYVAKNWSCTNCKQSWSHIELLSMKWKHECTTM